TTSIEQVTSVKRAFGTLARSLQTFHDFVEVRCWVQHGLIRFRDV
ncbi:unnamed protein product, partial [Heterotrigona itama]